MPLLEENDERAYERDGDFDFAGLLVLDLKNEIFFRLSFYPSLHQRRKKEVDLMQLTYPSILNHLCRVWRISGLRNKWMKTLKAFPYNTW